MRSERNSPSTVAVFRGSSNTRCRGSLKARLTQFKHHHARRTIWAGPDSSSSSLPRSALRRCPSPTVQRGQGRSGTNGHQARPVEIFQLAPCSRSRLKPSAWLPCSLPGSNAEPGSGGAPLFRPQISLPLSLVHFGYEIPLTVNLERITKHEDTDRLHHSHNRAARTGCG